MVKSQIYYATLSVIEFYGLIERSKKVSKQSSGLLPCTHTLGFKNPYSLTYSSEAFAPEASDVRAFFIVSPKAAAEG
jgi:hypothetical protein